MTISDPIRTGRKVAIDGDTLWIGSPRCLRHCVLGIVGPVILCDVACGYCRADGEDTQKHQEQEHGE